MAQASTIVIAPQAMEAMRAHARQGYPEEIWGIVFESPGGQVVRRMTNVQNALHAEDPKRHPRDARTAYSPDAQELMEASRDGDRPGWRIAIFYHSHPEHDAYFSETDKTHALWGGSADMGPAFPGAVYFVLSVYDREVTDVRAFAWDAAAADFLEIGLEERA